MGNEQGKAAGGKKVVKKDSKGNVLEVEEEVEEDDEEDDDDDDDYDEEEDEMVQQDLDEALAGFGHTTTPALSSSPKAGSGAGKPKAPQNAKVPVAKAKRPSQTTASRSGSMQRKKLSPAEELKRYCKAHQLTQISYLDLVDLRKALENDQTSIIEDVMKRCKLTPASRPYHPLAFSRLEHNFNTILHFVILHSSTQAFDLLQRAHEWEKTGQWKEAHFHAAFELENRYGVTPRQLLVQMLSESMQRLPPNFQDEMAASEDTKTIVPGASLAMAELSDASKERTQAELFAIVKRAFETFVHLRAVRTSHDLLVARHGRALNHARSGDGEAKSDDSEEDDDFDEEAKAKRTMLAKAAEKAVAEAANLQQDIEQAVKHTRDQLAAKGFNGAYLYSLRNAKSGGAPAATGEQKQPTQ